jgi:hypothetical protein
MIDLNFIKLLIERAQEKISFPTSDENNELLQSEIRHV